MGKAAIIAAIGGLAAVGFVIFGIVKPDPKTQKNLAQEYLENKQLPDLTFFKYAISNALSVFKKDTEPEAPA